MYCRKLKPLASPGVTVTSVMNDFITVMLALGGLAAAAAVGGMCVVVLLVWLCGGIRRSPSEAWRAADKR